MNNSLYLTIYMMCMLLFIKSFITLNSRIKIINAIYYYRCDCIKKSIKPTINYNDMESFNSTLLDLFCWNEKSVLPKNKYEIIKEYIL